MTEGVRRKRGIVWFVLGAAAVLGLGSGFDYLRHGGRDRGAQDCIARADGVLTNICDEAINYALCAHENILEPRRPCYAMGTIAPGDTARIEERPAQEEARFLACRDPYRPTRGHRQEKSNRYHYACGPGQSVLRLTE